MSRAVFVGGFCNGRSVVNNVSASLDAYFTDVDPFTFSEMVRDPEKVERASRNKTLITLSAGALAMQKLIDKPETAYLLNPPIPTPLVTLAIRAIIKYARLYTPGKGFNSMHELANVGVLGRSTIAETLTHPLSNQRQLPAIAEFNAVDEAIAAKNSGSDVTVVWTKQDAYYQPAPTDLEKLKENGLSSLLLNGEHDEVVLRPDAYLDAIFAAR